MDGDIDYTKYTIQQLREAAAAINREHFPANFSKLQQELQRRSVTLPTNNTSPPDARPRELPRKALKAPAILMVASIPVGIVLTILDWEYLRSTSNTTIAVETLVIFGTLMIWLAYKLAFGRNWARITLLVLVIVGAPFYLISLVALFMRAPALGAISVVQAFMQYVSLYVVFTEPARSEFRRFSKQS
jgi:hypothetical protein